METPQHSNLLYAPDCQKSCPSGGEAGHICAKGSGGTKPKAPMQRRTTMFKCEDKPNSSRQSSSLEMDEVTPYSRVVLAASFFTLFLGPSVNYATGVIHVALLDEFQEEVTLTAWIGSLFGCMFALMGPIASLVINVFNCRTCVVTAGVLCMLGFSTSFLVRDIRLLIVTYAIIAGLGTGLAQTGAVVVLGYYFPKKTSTASGICIAGAGLGMFVHPVLIRYLINTFGVRGAFLITGGLMLNVSVFGMLMRPSPFENERQKKVLGGLSIRRKLCLSVCGDVTSFIDVVTNISFVMFALSILLLCMALSTIYLFLPDFFVQTGASFPEASLAISVSGIGSMCSRILTGFASSDQRIGGFTIYSSLSGIIAIFTLFLPMFNQSSHLRILYGFFLGLYTGGEWVLMNTLTLDIVGLDHFATGIGLIMFACGVGYLIGPPIAGAVFEHSGYYNSVFLYSVALLFATTLCGFLSTLTWRDRRQGIKAEDKFAESDFKDVSEIQDLTISVQNTENGEPLKEENDSSL